MSYDGVGQKLILLRKKKKKKKHVLVTSSKNAAVVPLRGTKHRSSACMPYTISKILRKNPGSQCNDKHTAEKTQQSTAISQLYNSLRHHTRTTTPPSRIAKRHVAANKQARTNRVARMLKRHLQSTRSST